MIEVSTRLTKRFGNFTAVDQFIFGREGFDLRVSRARTVPENRP